MIKQPYLLYCAAGTCEIRFRQHSRKMKPGQICLVTPCGEVFLAVPRDSRLWRLELPACIFQSEPAGLHPKSLLSQFLCAAPGRDRSAYALYSPFPVNETESLLKDCMEKAALGTEILLPFLQALLRNLHEAWGYTLQLSDEEAVPGCVPVLAYIQKNYRTVTLKALAEEFHYAPPYVSSMISQSIGQRFTEVVRRLRLTEAVYYLQHTQRKLEEIALLVGYQTENQFSRAFRKQFGISPKSYRCCCQEDIKIPGDGKSPGIDNSVMPVQFPRQSYPSDCALPAADTF